MLKNQCRSETFSRHLGKNIADFFFQFALLTRINFQADMTFHAISSFVRSWEGWLIIQLNWKSLHSSTRGQLNKGTTSVVFLQLQSAHVNFQLITD